MYIPYSQIFEYCKKQIPDFTEKVQAALGELDRNRCPLKAACPDFFEEMLDAIEDWEEDNQYEETGFDDAPFIMVDDVFWAGASNN